MPSQFYHPKYWLVWLGLGILWLITRLPWRWQMRIGKTLGNVLYLAIPSRRKVSYINLKIAFPTLNTQQIKTLNKAHFVSLSQGLIDAALSWWGKQDKVDTLTHIEGLEHLEKAQQQGPVLLVGAHFTSLEIAARIISSLYKIDAVYRPHQNELLEYLVAKERNKRFRSTISKYNIRQMIKSLRKGQIAWYATDQNYRKNNSLLVPFFGVDAPSNPSTARIAKMTKAQVIPVFSVRLFPKKTGDSEGYLLRFEAPLKDFPSGDDYQDTLHLNHIIEAQINEFPEQYLWTHERYKTYHDDKLDFYQYYIDQHKDAETA